MNTAGIICPLKDDSFIIKKQYAEMLEYFGWKPVLIPLGTEPDFNTLNLLVFPGGGDIHSVFFGEKTIPELRTVDMARDYYELNICRYAAQKQLPILGICRGMQIINVALNGTLIQNLASAELSIHDNNKHIVNVTNNRIFSITGCKSFMVNSYHHQALARISPKLTPILAKDNVIEGIIGNKILGLQYHPEIIYKQSIPTQNIICRFLYEIQ